MIDHLTSFVLVSVGRKSRITIIRSRGRDDIRLDLGVAKAVQVIFMAGVARL